MKVKNNEPGPNQVLTPPSVFMESYNKGIPDNFPHASIKTLKQFQALHPALFKRGDEWSIDKHRKKLMDWLPSYKEIKITPAIS